MGIVGITIIISADGCFSQTVGLVIIVIIFKSSRPTAVFGNMFLFFHIAGFVIDVCFCVISEGISIVGVDGIAIDKKMITERCIIDKSRFGLYIRLPGLFSACCTDQPVNSIVFIIIQGLCIFIIKKNVSLCSLFYPGDIANRVVSIF